MHGPKGDCIPVFSDPQSFQVTTGLLRLAPDTACFGSEAPFAS